MSARHIPWWVTVAVAAVVAAAGCAGWGVHAAMNRSPGMVDGIAITRDEVQLYRTVCSSQPCSSVRSIDGQSSEVQKQTFARGMVHQMAEDKALFILARDHGFGDVTAFDAFEQVREQTNSRKTALAAQGKTVYGVTSYSDTAFRSRVLDQARAYLKEELADRGEELFVSDAEARVWFTQHRKEWTAEPAIGVIHLMVPGSSLDQAKQALAAIGSHTGNMASYLTGAVAGSQTSSVTIDPNATVAPELQAVAQQVQGLAVGQSTPWHTTTDGYDCYVVTDIAAGSDEENWQRYESRIRERLADSKLNHLIEQTRARHETAVDINRLIRLME